MRRPVWLALGLALFAAGLSSGCVTRRVMITSDPPGAIVYRDGQPLGPTPVEQPFVYYGKYRYRLVKDGYAPLDVEPELCPPWYQYPGIDFIAETLIPYPFRDVQQVHFVLQPLETVRNDDVRSAAEILRGRGKQIGPAVPPPRRAGKESPADGPFVGVAPPANKAQATTGAKESDGSSTAKTSAKRLEKQKDPPGNVGFQTAPAGQADPALSPSPDAPSR